MSKKKVSLQSVNKPILNVNKSLLKLDNPRKKIVYFIKSNKFSKYHFGRKSKILYIGKTDRRGSKRPLESLRDRAIGYLAERGVQHLEIVYIRASGKKNVDIAHKLERACLHQFREYYGDIPKGNTKGSKRIELTDEKRYINLSRLTEIIKKLSQ